MVSFLVFLGSAQAQNFWIPAERFDEHSSSALEGTSATDAINAGSPKAIRVLEEGEQVRIQVGQDSALEAFLDANPEFEVCAFVASEDSADLNDIRAKHFDPTLSDRHTIGDTYQMWCSRGGSLDNDNVLSGGVKVIAPSDGAVKVRGISIRSVDGDPEPETDLLSAYEYSRALGYLWADGGISTDGEYLTFSKRSTSTSRHFGSVAESYFGDDLSTNSQGTRYKVQLDGTTPADFLAGWVEPTDPQAFLTSMIEREGAVVSGRVLDDADRGRCADFKTFIDGMNPACEAAACTDSSCQTPNCAFIANGKKRNVPDFGGPNTNCGVYLSGNAADWVDLFSGDDYHFVKTDRTPGGEPFKYPWDSRPAYTE